jgi:putative ABC transport system permease protein
MLKLALYIDVIRMALATLWANKMRSALTVLGIVIGITSIVGMTALIRGFDGSLKDIIKQLGPKTVFVMKMQGMVSGKEFLELIKRPNLTVEDAKAIEREAETLQMVDVWLGAGGPGGARQQAFYRHLRSKQLSILGTTEKYAEVNALPMETGRSFTETEVQHRRALIVLGNAPAQALFPGVDPIGKRIRLGSVPFTVVGVLSKRPSPGGMGTGQDDLAIIPHTVYQKSFALRGMRIGKSTWLPVMLVCVPRDDVSREEAMAEVEKIMRIRHGLKLDQPDDFQLVTQDSMLKLFDDLTKYIYLGLVVLSSIALMVGGIGVMSIMMLAVTERTREIGVRKALGARRREILWQFLLEASVLTSLGGLVGIALGSSVALLIHWATNFPVSMPITAFLIGFAFSGGIGLFFGIFPAYKASRLDPIEALRYE